MIVVRHEQHRASVKKRGGNRIDNRVGLTGARRALDIGQRIFHRIVDGKELIQIHPVIDKHNRVFLAPVRPS